MDDFTAWLKSNNLQSYQQALEDQGYDDVRDLAGLSDVELEDLTTTLQMKPGHHKKLLRILGEAQKKIRLKKKEEEANDRIELALAGKSGVKAVQTPARIIDGDAAPPADVIPFSSLPANRGCIFISWRMSESYVEVEALESALRSLGAEVLVVRDLPGADLLRSVSEGMAKADLVIIMGTLTYGRVTNGMFDTYKEMNLIFADNKPFFLINMLPAGVTRFAEATTNMVLNLSTTAWHPWTPGTPITSNIAQCIMDKLNEVLHNPMDTQMSKAKSELDVAEQFRSQVRSRFKAVEKAWLSFDLKKRNHLSRSDFKRICFTLGMRCSDAQRKLLRLKLDPHNSKRISFEAFVEFMDESQKRTENGKQAHGILATLSMDVPSLPDSFRPRLNVENQLKSRLLDRESKLCVTAVGMGGVGKSVTTSAVVRSEEIRKRFNDGIAWIGMNQAPLLLELQRRCFLQLTKDHLPLKIRSSVEEQHVCLSDALISKTCLIVLDDCWDKQHAKCFDVVDNTTKSKLLVSTRIVGLLENSAEVKLALMTNEEAIDLLAHGAGLDFQEVPHAIAEVVGLCGRLPLCLNIAASAILDHGDNWQEEVLPEMRKGFSQLASGDDGSAKELSIQDSVIVTSVASIVGKDAERIKRFFISSCVFGEDQRVPSPLFVTLWAAAAKASAHAKKKNAVKYQITIRETKKMVTVLVRRSLFLELVRGSVQLHDIVREYVLARVEKDRKTTGGLHLLQRIFVSEFLASQKQWEDVAGPTIPRGKENDWYLSTGALQWHMQLAWTRPLVKDALACSWLLQTQEQIMACAVKAIPLEGQVELADDVAQTGELEKAVRILHEVIQRREMPLSEMQANAKQLFSYVDSIPVRERSAAVTKYDATVAYKLYSHSDKVSAHAAFMFSRLMAALDQGASLGHLMIATLVNFKAAQLIGFFPSTSRPNPSKSEFDEGRQLFRRAAKEFEAAIVVGEISNPLEAYARKWSNCLYPFHVFAADYWTEPLDTKETARVQVAELAKAAADYEYDISHPYKRIMYGKTDVFLEQGNALVVLALWWCDKRSVNDYLTKWKDGQLRAIAEGDVLFVEYFYVIPVLRVIPALDCLWQVLRAVGMSWQELDNFQFCGLQWAWTLPCDEAFNSQPKTCRMIAKLNCFLCAPDQVETLEVLNYLPQPGTCRWVHDRCNHIHSSTEPLEVLMSQAALACGESSVCLDLAASHAKEAIPRHSMAQKVMHAQTALGNGMARRDQARRSNNEVSEETLVVLEEALASAKKMKLSKYVELIHKIARVAR